MDALIPDLPAVESQFSLFGILWTVLVVEPAHDWAWNVEAINDHGEFITMTIPTDQRTVA